MALHTDRIACNTAMQSLLLECAMRVVTIAAADQSLVHLVMKGLRKSRFYISVAGVAELWLRGLKQLFFTLERMDAVATCASNVRLTVGGTLKIWMCSCMAGKTLLVNNLWCSLAELEDLRDIAT
jgi:hypothetical protein